MSQNAAEVPPWKKGLVYTLPGAEAVTVRHDLQFTAADGGALPLDLYLPPGVSGTPRLPAAIIAAGYSDARTPKVFPCAFKEVECVVSWARLLAASGIAAVTYSNREPAGDLHAALGYVRQNSATLGIDENRIGVWAASGNVPVALSLLMKQAGHSLKCAVLCYGFMLDFDGATMVAETAAKYQFVNPCAGKSLDDVDRDVRLFIARAGRDQFQGLNDSIDQFVAKALAANLPLTVVNHAEAPHAFDMFHDSDETRAIIEQILAFTRVHLGASSAG
jgi:hypothetical protein